MRETFELRRENHVHEDGRKQHGEQKVPRRLFKDFHLSGEAVGVARGKADLLDGVHGVAGREVERIAARDVGVNSDFKFSVVAPKRGRAGAANDGGDIFETDLAEFARGHHHLREDVRIVALALEELHDDGILFGAFREARNFSLAGIEKADGIADVGHAYADVGGALAVDFDLQFGRVEVEAGVDVDQVGILVHQVGDLFADVGEFIEFGAANHGADREIGFAAEDRGQANVRDHVAIAGQVAADFGGELFVAAFSFAARDETNEEMRVVCWAVGERLHEGDFGEGDDALREFGGASRGDRKSGAFGEREGTDELGLIIGGNPVAADEMVEAKRREESADANENDHPTMRQRPLQERQVGLFDGVQDSRGVGFFLAFADAEDARGHHRREREGHQQRDEDGHRHRPTKRIHIFAGVAIHESDGEKDDDQRKRGGHDGEADFLRGLDGCVFAVLAFFFHEADDIFEHDDGVVDDDADGEGERQQRHVVERKIHAAHEREGGDDACGDGDSRDQHGAPVAHKKKNDGAGKNAAKDQVFEERVNGRFDEVGDVVNDQELH